MNLRQWPLPLMGPGKQAARISFYFPQLATSTNCIYFIYVSEITKNDKEQPPHWSIEQRILSAYNKTHMRLAWLLALLYLRAQAVMSHV